MSSGARRVVEQLDRIGRGIENGLLVGLLGSLVLLAVAQIVLREMFGTGVVWADELVRLIVLWLAMAGSIAAARDDRHIRIDVLSQWLPARMVTVTRIAVDVFAAAICALIAWQAFRYLGIEREFEDTVLTGLPAWIAHAIVPLAFLLISYRFVVSALNCLLAPARRTDRPKSP